MSRYTTVSAALLAAALLSTAQAAPLMERNLNSEDAMAAYERMMSSCGPNLNNVTVVFVDRAGQVVLQARANGAALHNLDLARRKAYTGRTFRTKSIEWRDRTTGSQPAAGQRMLAEVIPLGGGSPIMIGEEVIGGVGVSGAMGGQPGDQACSDAGAAAVVALAR
jgi:uncharacterized protein GlcG (DUF336 family)